MLKAVFGYDNSYAGAILTAIQTYNEIEGQKTYHERHVHRIEDGSADIQYMCEIWFTLRVVEQQPPVYEYVGSRGIDPTDPNWRDKWEALNSQALDTTQAVLSSDDPTGVITTVETTVDLDVLRNTD